MSFAGASASGDQPSRGPWLSDERKRAFLVPNDPPESCGISGKWLVNGWEMVGKWLGNGWEMVGKWLVSPPILGTIKVGKILRSTKKAAFLWLKSLFFASQISILDPKTLCRPGRSCCAR